MATNNQNGKQKITPFLWFDKQAEEAAKFYTSVFKNSKITDTVLNTTDTPSGETGSVLTVGFTIEGQQFTALNGGPEFKFNPSVSFFVECKTEEEVEQLWSKLSDGGAVLMPLDKYFFSKKYGWLSDKFGVSWQLILSEGELKQTIVPSLMFVGNVYGKAEEAMNFYISVFKNSKIGNVSPYGANMEPDKEGSIAYADFQLENQWFATMESAREHNFAFNEAISFAVSCDTQDEIDSYWEKLSSEGGKEVQCGWLTDKYGVSWQIVPAILPKLLQDKDKEKAKRVMQALMKMVKLDIAALEQA
jgi:predicted 3-demethylubiquinone-9 3-methyltransferase (glyoxalase superfamily)